jgi:hypothetical protein
MTMITLHVKAKRKIHDNLGHKEHSTRYPHLYRTFVNIHNYIRVLRTNKIHTFYINVLI